MGFVIIAAVWNMVFIVSLKCTSFVGVPMVGLLNALSNVLATTKYGYLHNEYRYLYIHEPNNGMYLYNLYKKEPWLLLCSDPLIYLLYI